MDGVASFLPQDVISHILKFLPVKTLIRFQSVCKHWKNLIKTPFFIADHLHHSSQHRPCLLFHSDLIHQRLRLYLLDGEMQIVEVHNMPVFDGKFWIAGSSNGLLCLQIEKNGNRNSPPSLLLWNPAFREVREVPTTIPDFEGDCDIGFGYSEIVNDYKIVRLYVSNNDFKVRLMEVYSLGIGSWKNIEADNLGGLCMHPKGFTLNGAIFWFGFKNDIGEVSQCVIVSFDISTEVFALIPGPALGMRYTVHLTKFEHRLALLCSNPVRDGQSCLIELWVLNEGTGESSERWSWALKYTSSPHPHLLHPITIWKDEIACIHHQWSCGRDPKHGERTVMSNFTNTELKVLFDHGNYIINYVESLVPVSNIHVEGS